MSVVVDEAVVGQADDVDEAVEQLDAAVEQEAFDFGSLSQKEKDALAFRALWVDTGYLTEDGKPNHGPVLEKLYEFVSTAVVNRLGERSDKALKRSRFVGVAWPHLEEPEPAIPELNAFLKRAADQWIWGQLKPAADGPVQMLVTEKMPGYILCHYAKVKTHEASVYLTQDYACINEDWTEPKAKKVKSAADTYGKNMAFAIRSLPQHARKFDKRFKEATKKAIDSGSDLVMTALEAVRPSESDSE